MNERWCYIKLEQWTRMNLICSFYFHNIKLVEYKPFGRYYSTNPEYVVCG